MVVTLEAIIDLVIFQMSGKEFCADTKKVMAILKPEELSYIPATESTGPVPILIRDNKEYVLINIKKYLRLKNDKFTNETRAIFLELNDERIVFFADKVIEIISINPQSAHETSYFVGNETEKFIEGVLKYEDRLFMVPDYKEISLHAIQNL